MFVFYTSVKHPYHSRRAYENVWRLLQNTLASVCNQTNDDFRVIVLCNKVLSDFRDIPRIHGHTEFVEVGFPPVTESKTLVKSYGLLDIGAKNAVALSAAAKYDPEYVMRVDADDFVANDIVEYCARHPGGHGWYIHKGYLILEDSCAKKNDFNQRCGTCNIFNYKMITGHFDISKVDPINRESILSNVDDLFLRQILGSHKHAPKFLAEHGTPMKRFPKRAAAWLLDHGENLGGDRADRLNLGRMVPMTDKMKSYFNIEARTAPLIREQQPAICANTNQLTSAGLSLP